METLLQPLRSFKEQYTYTPNIINPSSCQYTSFVVCGTGGSAISTTLLKTLFPELPLTLHNSYGVPASIKEGTLYILNSYSGNTEEIIEAYNRLIKEKIPFAIITKGGTLLAQAVKNNHTHIQLPDTPLEPRFSIGYQMIALLSLMGEEKKIAALTKAGAHIHEDKAEEEGKKLAEHFEGLYPILYASAHLYPVAYLVKAAVNEGAKIPCFVNTIPEANHNELQSFTEGTESVFGFLYYTSDYDHTRIVKRFETMKTLYGNNGFTQASVTIDHTDITELLQLVLSGYYMATYMAIARNVDPYTTPLIATFKKNMAQ